MFCFFLYGGKEVPAFIAKEGVKSLPGVGYMTHVMQCLFIERVDSKKDHRLRLLEQIKERQIQAE